MIKVVRNKRTKKWMYEAKWRGQVVAPTRGWPSKVEAMREAWNTLLFLRRMI